MYFLSSSSNGRSLHKWSVLLQEDMAIKNCITRHKTSPQRSPKQHRLQQRSWLLTRATKQDPIAEDITYVGQRT